jgi:glycosyltransferase involved in cell wall biosynthesis
MVKENTIVIYHQLKQGGGLIFLNSLRKQLQLLGYKIIIFKPSKKTFKPSNNKLRNILKYLYYVIIELNIENRSLAKEIISLNPKYLLIFPSYITQAPSILLFVKKCNPIYIFTESKREFYEKTSFDYNYIHKIIARMLLFPIKILDKYLTRFTVNVIPISSYSQNVLLNIYGKSSPFILKPAIKETKSQIRIIENNLQFISVGLITKLKGHYYSIKQINKLKSKKVSLIIVGKDSHESKHITSKTEPKIKIFNKCSNKEKNRCLNKSSFYLANQENEPYGISTLEATNILFILGKNEGGTPEIIQSGINGFLYPNNIDISVSILEEFINKKQIKYLQTCIINWKNTALNLVKILKYCDLHNTINEK